MAERGGAAGYNTPLHSYIDQTAQQRYIVSSKFTLYINLICGCKLKMELCTSELRQCLIPYNEVLRWSPGCVGPPIQIQMIPYSVATESLLEGEVACELAEVTIYDKVCEFLFQLDIYSSLNLRYSEIDFVHKTFNIFKRKKLAYT